MGAPIALVAGLGAGELADEIVELVGTAIQNITTNNAYAHWQNDVIVVTGSQTPTSVLNQGFYPLAWVSALCLGATYGRRWWLGLGIATSLWLGAQSTSALAFNDTVFVDVGGLIGAALLCMYGARRAAAAPSPRLNSNFELQHYPDRSTSWLEALTPFTRSEFSRIRNTFRHDPRNIDQALSDPSFQPLRLKLTETLYAGLPAMIVALAWNVFSYAYIALRADNMDAAISHFAVSEFFSLLTDILFSYLIPLSVLIWGAVATAPLVRRSPSPRNDRRTARWLFFTFDGVYGFQIQRAASLGLALLAAGLPWALSDQQGFTGIGTGVSALGAALTIFAIPATIYMNIYHIPNLVMNFAGPNLAVNKIRAFFFYLLFGTIASIFIGLAFQVIVYGLQIAQEQAEERLLTPLRARNDRGEVQDQAPPAPPHVPDRARVTSSNPTRLNYIATTSESIDNVRRVQFLLNLLGRDVGEVDGIRGVRTHADVLP